MERGRESERLEPQIPFVRASSATARDSASSLSLSSPYALSALPIYAPPPLPLCVSLALSFFSSILPLPRRSAESVPSCASTTSPPSPSANPLSLPPALSPNRLCHSIAAESSQPDAGPARGRNDPRARQGRAEGVIRSSPYVHRDALGIRIIKLREIPSARPFLYPAARASRDTAI